MDLMLKLGTAVPVLQDALVPNPTTVLPRKVYVTYTGLKHSFTFTYCELHSAYE